MGVYLAVSIPVSVFPSTDFPRIVVGADVGVYPIDQMLVTVTQPFEEAVNTVPGLDHVTSITSRGSAEIDLFFNWSVDMNQTLAAGERGAGARSTHAARECESDGESPDLRRVSHPRLQPDLRQDSADHSLGTRRITPSSLA